ncbi:5'/3'-nucleotidase SurE [Sandaracinus amylolyticus]|uniref:5'-nucleotidase SurE n=1 Tax=Sandaracinus amylolyticus TaxID=927083 RepID=A0A0F6W234_9BACT|nr:5'/3'-nucleotidase SurE [Sandaracinus amylolyticus]AKF05506.1 5-nucleotidase SurE [Sandaracinus amylolyticus]
MSNDDGIYSPGIRALAELASELGEVRIVAPDSEMSSVAHAITATRPMRVQRTQIGDFDAYRVNGTPADCVALGAHAWERVDLVLSGINLGLNVGNGMWHSGTLAAARQAALLGIRGIALSAPAPDEGTADYDALAPYVRRVLAVLAHHHALELVNVNFPVAPRGIQWTRQSLRHYDGRVVPDRAPYGRELFWFAALPVETTEEGTDRWAVEHDLVSVTPLRRDITDHAALRRELEGDAVAQERP